MQKRIQTIIATCITLLWSAQFSSLVFADSRAITDTLSLRGTAMYTYYSFEVYTGYLYTEPNEVKIYEKLGDIPLRLELKYHRDLSAQDFIESGESFMKDNPEIAFESIKKERDQINSMYKDIKEGDVYRIDYTLEEGISLYLNGQKQGSIHGKQFAKSYLGIWLSKYSLSRSFTEKLLNEKIIE